MAARKRLANGVGSPLLPGIKDVVLPMHGSSLCPQRQNRTTDLALQIRIVVSQIDRSARAVVLACGVNRFRHAERPQIFSKGFLADRVSRKSIEPRSEPELGAIADHRLRQRFWLN